MQEARTSRELAQDNERQSKMIFILTIVTIIFVSILGSIDGGLIANYYIQLPLSFLASFLALNVKQFPRTEAGQQFSLRWVAGIICKRASDMMGIGIHG